MAKDPCHLTPKQRLACDCDCAEIKAQQAFEKSVEKEQAQTTKPAETKSEPSTGPKNLTPAGYKARRLVESN